MPRHNADLYLVIALAVLAGLTALLAQGLLVVRVPVSLLLVLVLPGWAAGAALLPSRTVDTAERVILTVGGSLVFSALGGFLLNWTPWGLRPATWAVFLAAVTIVAALIAIGRRGATGAPSTLRLALPPPRQSLLLALAAVTVGGAFVVATAGATRQTQGFTQLWLLPSTPGSMTDRLGVTSSELTTVTYRLQLEQGGQVLQQWPAIRLAPGQQWETTVVPPPTAKASEPVTAVLYRGASPATPYRHVLLWPAGQG
jgi:hypothetical protein